MLPLLAGGQCDRDRNTASRSVVRSIGRVIRFSALARLGKLARAAAILAALVTAVGLANAEPAGPDTVVADSGMAAMTVDLGGAASPSPDGTSVVSYVTPSAVAPQGPVSSAAHARHWTLRDPGSVRPTRILAGPSTDGSVTTFRPPAHANVSMFSWRELAFAGLIGAFALGALLALTGGGDHRRTRHY